MNAAPAPQAVTATPPALLPSAEAEGADLYAALPSFVYRSEAFAEDLPQAVPPRPLPAAGTPLLRRWVLRAVPLALGLAGAGGLAADTLRWVV
jgi:hypothetical protein